MFARLTGSMMAFLGTALVIDSDISRYGKLPYEMYLLFLCPITKFFYPELESKRLRVLTLNGMAQCAFYGNIIHIAHQHYKWVNIYYANLMAVMFQCYYMLHIGCWNNYLIPKWPLRVNWFFINILTLFFLITGYLITPYCGTANIRCHYYSYFLFLETYINWSSKKFSLVPCFWFGEEYFGYWKQMIVTVHAT